jgi:hypothetical protein
VVKNLLLMNVKKLFPKKEKYYCSRSCSNKRYHSDATKEKIRNGVYKTLEGNGYEKIIIKCKNCGEEFIRNRERRKFCSISCSSTWNNLHYNSNKKPKFFYLMNLTKGELFKKKRCLL